MYPFNWLSYKIFKNFLVHILSIYIMYQVLQVYTSFSFFDNFLSRSIKVGQSSSRRRRLRVVETSPRRCRDVAETSSQLFLNHLVSSRSRRRLGGDVAETSSQLFLNHLVSSRSSSSKTYLVAATSPRRLRDQLET